ncbi:MAG TPA: hypothetical protein VGG02_06845 [Chthoniobacterales bacterium]|jgi:hypothetical protein
MKPATQYNILFLLGGTLGFLGMFHATVWLPDWVQGPFTAAMVVCIWAVVWLQQRAKARGGAGVVTETPSQNRRYIWLLLVAVFAASATEPFLMPAEGITLPLAQRVIISAVGFALLAAIVIIVRKGSPGSARLRRGSMVMLGMLLVVALWGGYGVFTEIRQNRVRSFDQQLGAAWREAQKLPPGFGRGEDFLARLKAIDTTSLPADLRQALSDYIAAYQAGVEAFMAGRDDPASSKKMGQALLRIRALEQKY